MAIEKPTLARGQSNVPVGVNQAGQLHAPLMLSVTEKGRPLDPLSVEFTVVRDAGSVQIFPPSGREAMTLTEFFPNGDKVAKGLFLPDFAIISTAEIGAHTINYFVKRDASHAEVTIAVPFLVEDVVLVEATGPALSPKPTNYATIDDIRSEGFKDEGKWQDDRIIEKIEMASRYIDKVTGRWFAPRLSTFFLDGDSVRSIIVPQPIIEIHEVRILTRTAVAVSSSDVVALADLIVYNRHLTQGLISPDDRNSPQIAFTTAGGSPIIGLSLFPRGQQNIAVTGIFGYTDPDPNETPFGVTPLPIKDVCRKIVARELEQLERFEDREDRQLRWRLTHERVGNRSISMSPDHRAGPWMGDPEIDGILLVYKRPIGMAAIGVGRPDASIVRHRVVTL